MTVESATYINTLDATYPASGDQRNEGDNHIRLIKSAVKATFPNIAGAANPTHTELNLLTGLTGSILSTGAPVAGQWTLMRSVTISGGPSAVDFVNGSGGVTFSSAYDEYLLVGSDITHGSSANAKLRLSFSINTGSSFGAANFAGGVITHDNTTLAGVNHTGATAYLPLIGEQSNASDSAAGIHFMLELTRPVSKQGQFGVFERYMASSPTFSKSGLATGRIDSGGSAIDAIRVLWDTGSFANTGTIKLYGRKV